jgi:hypothetical protein
MRLTIEEIERRLKQGQVRWTSPSFSCRVLVTRNKALQYKAVITSEAYHHVFQGYNDINGLDTWLEDPRCHRSNGFFYDLATWLSERLYPD